MPQFLLTHRCCSCRAIYIKLRIGLREHALDTMGQIWRAIVKRSYDANKRILGQRRLRHESHNLQSTRSFVSPRRELPNTTHAMGCQTAVLKLSPLGPGYRASGRGPRSFRGVSLRRLLERIRDLALAAALWGQRQNWPVPRAVHNLARQLLARPINQASAGASIEVDEWPKLIIQGGRVDVQRRSSGSNAQAGEAGNALRDAGRHGA